jgi:hypothetical protein
MLEGFPLGGLTGALNTSVDYGNYIRCVLSTLLIGTYYSIERRWGKLSSRPPEHGNRRDHLSSLAPSPTGLYATQVHHRPHHQIMIVQHGEAPSPAHACHSHPHFFPCRSPAMAMVAPPPMTAIVSSATASTAVNVSCNSNAGLL